jgi:DNA-binding beta-propeller fold protein YncE
MKRFLCLGAALVLSVVWVGCGDVFRPIIIPNPPQFPNPAAAHTVVTINDNGTINPGSVMVVDVGGDSDSGNRNIGLNPIHAVLQTASQMLIVNQSNDTKPNDSVSKISFSGTTPSGPPIPTITLPPSYDGSGNLVSAAPNFVATTESSQAYVLMPLYQPPNQNNIGGTIVPSVAVINASSDAVVTTLPVGTNPIAAAETPDGTKLYVANAGNGTTGSWSLSAFNTKDRSTRTITAAPNAQCNQPPCAAPVWISARSDSQQAYVLESDGTLGYLDTALTTGDTFTETSIQVPPAPVPPDVLLSSAIMWYDVVLNRLYIPGGDQIAIIDVSGSAPQQAPNSPITNLPVVQPSARLRSDPCSKTSAASAVTTVAVTSLPDGSRAYVGAYYSDGAGNICPQVTVITTSNNTIETSLAIPGYPDATISSSPYYVPVCANTRFRITMAVGGDSSRAYLASCDGGSVNIIYTSTDSYVESMTGPNSARNPIQGTTPPPQNPVFMIAGP